MILGCFQPEDTDFAGISLFAIASRGTFLSGNEAAFRADPSSDAGMGRTCELSELSIWDLTELEANSI
jgi:hypothetical protein